MKLILVAALTGLTLGSGWAGVVGWSLKYTRSHRATNNKFTIGLTQVIVLITMVGGLLLLQMFGGLFDIKRHSAPQYAATYAYIVGCIGVLSLVLRADYRWRNSLRQQNKNK